MKQTNTHIRNIARRLFHHKQGLARPRLMHPNRDWLIGVLVGALIILLMIAWSAYTYLDQRDAIDLDETTIEAEVPTYNADSVENALDIFAEREEAFAQLNQTDVPVVAPPIESVDTDGSTTTSSTTPEVIVEVEEPEEAAGQTSTTTAATTTTTSTNPILEREENVGTPTLIN